MAKYLLDLSHSIDHGLITYKGLPAPIVCDFLSREQSKQHYAPGTEFQIGKIEMVATLAPISTVRFIVMKTGEICQSLS